MNIKGKMNQPGIIIKYDKFIFSQYLLLNRKVGIIFINKIQY